MAPDMRVGPFDPAASPGQKQTGYTVSGMAWYRKVFSAFNPEEKKGSSLWIRFDGIYMASTIIINGKTSKDMFFPYGYTTFAVDATPYLNTSGTNVIAIHVNASGSNSRWYAGAGIFRHVSITTLNSLSFDRNEGISPGVLVTTPASKIDVTAKTADTRFTVAINNKMETSKELIVRFNVSGVESRSVKITANKSTQTETFTEMHLTDVKLWGPEHPFLYSVTVELMDTDNTLLDVVQSVFGVRKLEFDSEHGFRLNGVTTKLYGGCVHHDNGPLGSKAIARADERRVMNLKKLGYNAIRTSHNPVSPAFVEACDKHGVMLMEEAFDCFSAGKNADDYHLYFNNSWRSDIYRMVVRDRNHPSIIMWSIGNEIPIRNSPLGVDYAHQLVQKVKELDSPEFGRAVTSAYPGVGNQADPYLNELDVAGYNYSPQRYQLDHQRNASRVIVATESFPDQSYTYWEGVWNNSWVIGDFIWTAIDYIGESAIGGNGYNTPDLEACGGYCPQGFAWHDSYCGDIDIVGLRKPQSYYRSVLWNVSELEMAVHEPVPPGQQEVVASWGWPDERQTWTWPSVQEGFNMSVNVYTRYNSVSLYLNDKELGTQSVSEASQFTANFVVPYEKGTLKAVAKDKNSKMQAEKEFTTGSNKPTKLQLDSDQQELTTSRDDLAYVVATVQDEDNRNVVSAVDVVFSVEGEGELLAVGSGKPDDLTSFYAGHRNTYRGHVVAIIRPTGKPGVIQIKAQCSDEKLECSSSGAASLSITTKQA
eukprot:m.344579 g.344579  ORF g.344579 m.344579 type:complete len:762 (+) comp24724_c0_seq1:220-2505(+)